VAEKPSYRLSFSRRRCLVLADGFYEWRKEAGSQAKTPYYISREDGLPFGLAGLWDQWSDGDGPPLKTCSIITVPANEFMRPLHHRMPVLMGPAELADWFDVDATRDRLLQMLLGPQSTELQAWPVARALNNPVNEGPELISPAQ